MCSDTLVLNADALPLSVLPLSTENWQDAIKNVWAGQVDIIHTYPDWVVHSPSVTLEVPSVIMLKHYIKVSKSVKFNKNNVYLRDDYTCQYCGLNCEDKRDMLTYEHVVPRFHGGKTTWTNIVSACMPCNHAKGHSLNYKKPSIMPHKPDYWSLAAKQKRKPITVPDEQWIPYLDWEGEITIKEQSGVISTFG